MTLHIIKLRVGCDSVEDLRQWQKEKLARVRKTGEKPVLTHWTRICRSAATMCSTAARSTG
jgi:hypothetical protein